jgi:APA family basic amino acid/polyamine antiporter
LTRRLGLADAVFLGLGSMIGAGVFAAFAPAAHAAGAGLLPALVVAAVVAYCNATSSARLAAIHPESGGTYVYGRERRGEFWGYLAGWGFLTGKTASCAAMALTVVAYAAPGLGQPWRSLLAVAVVAALTAVNYVGVHRSAPATRVIVTCTLLVLTIAAVTMGAGPHAGGPLVAWPGTGGILEAAGLLFFAFAGYARLATLGEEVRDPARTIPRALGITLVVYAALAVLLLVQLGPAALAASPDPIAAAVPGWLAPVVRVGAALAALGSLLALVLGVSRTTLAMSRERPPPRRAPALRRAAPGRRPDRRRARGVARPAGRDRFLVLHRPELLRGGADPAFVTLGRRSRSGEMRGAGLQPAVDVGAGRCWEPRPTAFAGCAGEKSPNRPKHPKKVGCPGVAHLV